MSVGGSCPQIAEEAEAHDGEDRHDEDFHDRSLLGPGVVTVDDRTGQLLAPSSACDA
jgi:hypothetical protein